MNFGSDVSVVVQGPVVGSADAPLADRKTRLALDSVRRVLPEAEIVLSTWKGASVADLPFDTLVTSEDPGSLQGGVGIVYNVNRQIVSTREGLRRASRPHALKLRSDCQLLHDGFRRYFGRFPDRARCHRYFQDRIVGCELFFRNPAGDHAAYLFHIGDTAMFGRRDDMLALWDVEFAPEHEVVGWTSRIPASRLPHFGGGHVFTFRYVEEQHIWLAFLRKQGARFELQFPGDFTVELAKESELTIMNNFVIAGAEDFGVHLPTKLFSESRSPSAVYSHDDWRTLYAIYCGNGAGDGGLVRRQKQLAAIHRRRIVRAQIMRLLNAEQRLIEKLLRLGACLRRPFLRGNPPL
jgi:WavE lipopolysaccharide synthesis